jgi:hypothetical protein
MYLPLTDREKSALRELSEREDRDPRFQAARFVREGLERAGALPPSIRTVDDRPAEPAR